MYTSFLDKKWFYKLVFSLLNKKEKEKDVYNKIREELLLLGYDCSNFSNADLKKKMIEMATYMIKLGINGKKACEAVYTLKNKLSWKRIMKK